MKKSRYLIFTFISLTALLTGCQSENSIEVEPAFQNYTKDDIKESAEFDEIISNKEKELKFDNINYESTSYKVEEKYIKNITNTYSYSNSENIEKAKLEEHAIFAYDHEKGAVNDFYFSASSMQNKNITIITEDLHNYIYSLYNQKIVKADIDSYLYEELADIASYLTFGGYAKANFALSNTFIADNVNNFSEFNQVDIPTTYYAKDNVYTSGIVFNDKEQVVLNNNFKETLSVSAVCQIVVSGQNITVSTEYQTKTIQSNYSEEYAEENYIPYSKLTQVTTYKAVKTLTIGDDVECDTVDLKNYSLVNSIR